MLSGILKALLMDFQARTGIRLVPGKLLFEWIVRLGAWIYERLQPRGPKSGTAFEAYHGHPYKSAIVPLGEIVMIRAPIDTPGHRRKLDTQWFKGAWVGRGEQNDGHIVLTEFGQITGKSARQYHLRIEYK